MTDQYKKWILHDLERDTNFFGVKSGKLILNSPISINEMDYLKSQLAKYEFVSITNKDSDPMNAQLIGRETSAFLADTNIQFVKKVEKGIKKPKQISFHQSIKKSQQILQLVNFPYSKFTEDPELEKRGGSHVYLKWVENSFGRDDKFFVLSTDEQENINGFLLYSFTGNKCVIELIAVSPSNVKGGVGSIMFKSLENELSRKRISKINVGTQVRNIGAINFYHKVGCKQVGCHQVFHLWNI